MSVSKLDRYASPIGVVCVVIGIGLIVLNFSNERTSEWWPLPLVGVGLGLFIRGFSQAKDSKGDG